MLATHCTAPEKEKEKIRSFSPSWDEFGWKTEVWLFFANAFRKVPMRAWGNSQKGRYRDSVYFKLLHISLDTLRSQIIQYVEHKQQQFVALRDWSARNEENCRFEDPKTNCNLSQQKASQEDKHQSPPSAEMSEMPLTPSYWWYNIIGGFLRQFCLIKQEIGILKVKNQFL